MDVVQAELTKAERDNDLIYHKVVLPISAIPAIGEGSMANSNIPPGLKDPRGALGNEPVMFGELVGWGARVAVDIYRDRRENWLRDEIYNRTAELDRMAER